MEELFLLQETIQKMLLSVDRRNWEETSSYFTNEVFCDYSSLSGGKGSYIKATDMIEGWKQLLPGFNATQHFISNQQFKVENDKAEVISYVKGYHYLLTAQGTETWLVNGSYIHELVKVNQQWKISRMTLQVSGILGNGELPRLAGEIVTARKNCSAIREKVNFCIKGEKVLGNLFRPAVLENGKKYPAVIVGGSWTTVKEMMAGTYAQKLADHGYIALVFDHRGFGESEGELRDVESPTQKIEDFKGAISFLRTVSFVNPDKINLLGVCASAGYLSKVAYQDERVNSLITVAGWFHNPTIVAAIYGGKAKVDKLLQQSREAFQFYSSTGKVNYVPACSDSDETAAMYGRFDYYFDENRGRIRQWANRFALMAWEGWLTFNPIETAHLITIPTYVIQSEAAATPQGVKEFYANLKCNKEIYWTTGNQFDFYDNEPKVNESISKIIEFLNKNN